MIYQELVQMTDVPDSAGNSRIVHCCTCGDGGLDHFKVSGTFNILTRTRLEGEII